MARPLLFLLLCLSKLAMAASLSDALQAYDSGHYQEAAPMLQALAGQGDATAQHKLSIMYFYGHGVPENEKTALRWARASAEQGNPEAMYFIANMYVFGDELPSTVENPDVEAAKWFFEAAGRGHADAEYGLGLMFLAGKGVEQNQDEAMKWIGRAAQHGHVSARSFLEGRSSGSGRPH